MNQIKEKSSNIFSKTLYRIKKWPLGTKRFFALSMALIITLLVIYINIVVHSFWPDESKVAPVQQENPVNSISNSLGQLVNQIGPILDRAISSSSQDTATDTSGIIDQNNSTSSSLISTSSVVE